MRNANLSVPVSARHAQKFRAVPINAPMRNIFVETRRTTWARTFRRLAPRVLQMLALTCGAIGVGFLWYVVFVIGVTRG